MYNYMTGLKAKVTEMSAEAADLTTYYQSNLTFYLLLGAAENQSSFISGNKLYLHIW